MINAAIKLDANSKGKVAKATKQVVNIPVLPQEKHDYYWHTVEADYVLCEPEIHAAEHAKVTHRRRIL